MTARTPFRLRCREAVELFDSLHLEGESADRLRIWISQREFKTAADRAIDAPALLAAIDKLEATLKTQSAV